ncbi:MAG TPA: type II toxin-antitoxin system CcdA family antitoxin [Ramlibacter sp.]|nr:type II toxin-antitoxin system CcdA family antitoxin [Ramlibacter sp.]
MRNPPAGQERRRAVNLTLSEDVVAQARNFTPNLSATVEELLAEYVADQKQSGERRAQMAQACAADWNAVHEAVGSFADDHVNL